MIFEFDWNHGLFEARSRGPKKRSGGRRESPELDIRRIAKIYLSNETKICIFITRIPRKSLHNFWGDLSKISFFLPLVDIYRHLLLLKSINVNRLFC